MMMIDAMEEIEEGIKVGGKRVKDVRFADDQGMVSGSEGGLQKLMDRLNRTAKEYDMKVNIKKTKSHESIKKRRRCNKHNNQWRNTRTSRAIQVPRSPHHKRWQMRDRNQDKDWYG